MTALFSCQGQTNVTRLEGSIYIKLIDIKSLYGEGEEKIKALKKEVENFDEAKSNASEKAYYSYYDILFKENLIDKPYALIKDKEEDIKRVFFSIDDYKKDVEPLLLNLDKNNEHIDISLEIKESDAGLYIATKIISIKKVKGKTDWKK